MMPPSTTPQMPGTAEREPPFITWHVEVPMIASIWPGAMACAAGAVTCASTFPVATAMPWGKPVRAAPAAVSDPAREPSRESGGPARRVSAKSSKPGCSAFRYSRLGYCPSW